ncbi:hypothetical protein MIND_00071500 [Mycena indigotica]|uniref:Ribosomal RNA-processing protein 17 n=1 Tax=Mycena indigotica TaxID=2126181 RepID=A0A8H6TF11_9AGAR|nr:uncharacterized protein MIND_00071500 [Mycena indigotica]KAF7315562.1 hypothetical protein MIND_00071500 [Mycena indigotica]
MAVITSHASASMSNLTNLTRSHTAIAAKKRAKKSQINEIIFDEDARREFLTGFHKRKVAKADAARKKAAERERQERLETRREQRRELRERALENAAQVEKAYGAADDSEDDEWEGISKKIEEEYEDQQMFATVVVEDFDPDTFVHGSTEPRSSSTNQPNSIRQPKAPAPEGKQPPSKQKLKPKKFRYETKAERSKQRDKQRARRTEKAELAGGKAARKRRRQ